MRLTGIQVNGSWKSEAEFNELTPGSYIIQVRDTNECYSEEDTVQVGGAIGIIIKIKIYHKNKQILCAN